MTPEERLAEIEAQNQAIRCLLADSRSCLDSIREQRKIECERKATSASADESGMAAFRKEWRERHAVLAEKLRRLAETVDRILRDRENGK